MSFSQKVTTKAGVTKLVVANTEEVLAHAVEEAQDEETPTSPDINTLPDEPVKKETKDTAKTAKARK